MQSIIAERKSDSRERRRYARYAVRCDCWLEHEGAAIYGPTADLGAGGLFLRTAVPLEHGQQVDVMLNITGASEPVVAHGVVTRRVRARHGRRHGLGVAFVDIVGGRENLQRLLDDR
jgi:hypothetical protein